MGGRGRSIVAAAEKAKTRLSSRLAEINRVSSLIQEMEANGVNFTRERLVVVTRNKLGEIVFLEKGSSRSGLEHIVKKHGDDFKRAWGISEKNIPAFLQKCIEKGQLIDVCNDPKGGKDYTYKYKGKKFTFITISKNGYIVTAFPIDEE